MTVERRQRDVSVESNGPAPARPLWPFWRYTRWVWLAGQLAIVVAIVSVALWLVLATLNWIFGLSMDLLRLFSSPLGVALVAGAAFMGGRASKQ